MCKSYVIIKRLYIGGFIMENSKKIVWYNLAFMAFSTVWGFGNVVNGFGYSNGIAGQAIFTWILMFALYFVPYALMVGELGSAFKDSGGGVSSWIHETMGPKLAYYAGWTYWACHITYIASKASGGLKGISQATSFLFMSNGQDWFDSLDTITVQALTMAIFLLFCWIASRGLNPLKKLTTLAGSSMFVMSILYIIMMLAAPAINPDGGFQALDFSWDSIIPQFNVNYFTSLSIFVFAVGGCEKISPYVNKVEDPARGFPKGMIALAIMVMVCAILGTIAMGMMFDPAMVANDLDGFVSNGSYWAFERLGAYYGIGSSLKVIYSICNAIGQLSTLVLSIDAPLRMLLDNEQAREFIPSGLLKQNKHGAYINGIWMVVILSGSIIAIQALGGSAQGILKQLTDLNSICMPLRYLWVFAAYIALRKAGDKFQAEYRFTKNQKFALVAGAWCFFVTAACCLLKIFGATDALSLALNIITPIVLTALGLILPVIKKNQDAKAKA